MIHYLKLTTFLIQNVISYLVQKQESLGLHHSQKIYSTKQKQKQVSKYSEYKS